jgi:hypothetical protein
MQGGQSIHTASGHSDSVEAGESLVVYDAEEAEMEMPNVIPGECYAAELSSNN